jgi:ATP/maltotriose-dependent transcriptional regulator MalT
MSRALVADVPTNASPKDALLATRFYIPSARPVQGIIPRPCPLGRLKCGPTGALTLLSAPAGFGKPTPLSQRAAARRAVTP